MKAILKHVFPGLLLIPLLISCNENDPPVASLYQTLQSSEHIVGNKEYIHTPFVTPGDRAYLVGHQDGSFPPLGWHVEGEMGGLWSHPVKLLDGFSAAMHSSREVLCLAEADSFVNYPFANTHIYANPYNTRVARTQFVPDGVPGIVIEYSFENLGQEKHEFLFEFNAFTDLRPVWLGERTGMHDSNDIITWNNELQAFAARDSLNPWNVIIGSPDKHLRYDLESNSCSTYVDGSGTNGSITWIVELPARGTKTITIVIAGNDAGFEIAREDFNYLKSRWRQLLDNKIKRYEQLDDFSNLTLEDSKMEQAFRWTKYNTDWLVQEVPGIGRGLTAGIPDYPWWFGADSEYALLGAVMVGQQETVFETISLLHKISESENGNGRVIHEASTNGAVFNPGNLNETPQFTSLIWNVFNWTGDMNFLKKYYPFLENGMSWLMQETDRDGNLLPDGFGMMEIHGLDSEMIDVAVYTQRAFDDLSSMAEILGRDSVAEVYKSRAEQLRDHIERSFWVEQFGSYADFTGTPEQARELIRDAIHRADSLDKPWAVKELKATANEISGLPEAQKQGFVLHHNWVVNTPMETGMADPDRAIQALETASEFVNPYGVFVTGIDRDESSGNQEGSFQTNRKIFTYIGAVMTLPTGVLAVAENNYGRADEALDYLQRMTRSFSFALPGSMYEVSPDFGMMTQAWTIYSFAVPIVSQFFGIRPDAFNEKILIKPHFPSSWNEAALTNVKIGNNSLDLSISSTPLKKTILISQSANWDIIIEQPYAEGAEWRVDGKVVRPETDNDIARFLMNQASAQIEITKASE